MNLDPLTTGLPCNLEAERMVLGSILLASDKSTVISSTLDASDFHLEAHRRIFARMKDLLDRNETVDRVTLSNELMKQGQLESVGGLTYLVGLDTDIPVLPNMDGYVRIVKEKSTLRKIIFAAQKIQDRCLGAAEDASDIATDLHAQAAKLSQRCITAVPDRTLADTVERVGLSKILEIPPGVIAPPWSHLTRELNGGVRPGEMWLIAARPGIGKSTVLLQWALEACRRGQRGILFTLEMTEDAMIRRAICCSGRISKNTFATDPSGAHAHIRHSIRASLNEIMELPLSIRSDCRTERQIIAAMAQEPKPDFVAIDYVGLVQSSGRAKENRNQEVSYISRKLKLAALDHGVGILLACQLNRGNETENRPPRMSDLRDSGSLEQDNDVVLLLDAPWARTKVDKEGNSIPRDLVKLLIAKQREGMSGGFVDLTLEGEFCRLTDAREQEPEVERPRLF